MSFVYIIFFRVCNKSYRDEVYHPNTQDKGIGEILIRKNRDGEIGCVHTAFQGDRSRFMPLASRAKQENVVRVNF